MTSLCSMKRGSNEIFSFPLACPIIIKSLATMIGGPANNCEVHRIQIYGVTSPLFCFRIINFVLCPATTREDRALLLKLCSSEWTDRLQPLSCWHGRKTNQANQSPSVLRTLWSREQWRRQAYIIIVIIYLTETVKQILHIIYTPNYNMELFGIYRFTCKD